VTDLLNHITLDELEELIPRASAEQAAAIEAALRRCYFPGKRQAQTPPEGEWAVWALMAGRGFGKTRTGAEWIVEEAERHPGTYAIVAPTYGDGRDICVEGESGVITVLRRRMPDVDWGRCWNRSLGVISMPSGGRIKVGSADEPERFRGWNFAGAWCDELGSWRRDDAWTQLRLATRLGRSRIVATMTPRPTKLVKTLIARSTTIVTRGSTFDNAANLSAEYLGEITDTYQGTRIGRQELYAELLVDTPGALWTVDNIEAHRVDRAPAMKRVVVAIDPAVTSGEDSDDTGIVAAGLGVDGDLYVLHDRTCRLSPDGWAQAAVALYDEVEGDRIVAEVNNGGDLVETVLRPSPRCTSRAECTTSAG
jgi:phage terminase large subunit-like protein